MCTFVYGHLVKHHLECWFYNNQSMVVHSYYHGRDQLERQSGVYKGRTHLLSGVQPSDQGPYTCDVTDEQASTLEKLLLLVRC
uniref:Ig-like domain-containing protein n=1 Tax=Oncorhynchus kisutch TaxID=8019 RepID=A0A8C7C5W5_ONCKI